MKRRGDGFTLIELLIAISLAAGVTAAATLLARSSLDYEGRHIERWTGREAIRDSQRLLEHYWSRRQKDRFTYRADRLLFESNEDNRRYLVGFSCDRLGENRYSLNRYRWPASSQEVARLQKGGEWPEAAAETLMPELRVCGFSFMAPPAATDQEAPARWVTEWTGTTHPSLLRLDVAGARGLLPPMIFQASAS